MRKLLLLSCSIAASCSASGQATETDTGGGGAPPAGSTDLAEHWPEGSFVTSLTGLGGSPIGLTPLTWVRCVELVLFLARTDLAGSAGHVYHDA